MSRIVLVEPVKMLQYAFVVALLPEHPVQVMEKLPDAETMAEADLVIIDAGTLRERDLLPLVEDCAAQSSQAPVLWVDVEASGAFAAAKNLTRLSAPVKRDELRSAVVENLRRASRSEASSEPAAIRTGAGVAAKTKIAGPHAGRVVAEHDTPLIELVDVIEVTPELDKSFEAENKN